ncbi:MAG: O-antigen ligase family protein [Oligoflexus sp.]
MSYSRILLEIHIFSLLSGLLFFLLKASPVAIAPIVIYVSIRSIPIIQTIDYRNIVIFLVGLALFIDDVSQVAWGRNIEMPTELLGKILFESFGLTGLEMATIFLLLWIVLIEQPSAKISWIRHGLVSLTLMISSYFLVSFFSAFVGLIKGGDLNIHFIQSRFLHLLPMWTVIGFFCIDHEAIATRIMKVIAVVMTLKSVQALLVYLVYPGDMLDPEYLVDHYFSMFSVIALVFTIGIIVSRQHSIWLRSFLSLGSLPVFLVYILNQRRTSYVGAIFALLLIPLFFKREWYKRYAANILIVAGLLIAIVGSTWFLPAPFSFLRTTIDSLQEEQTMEFPAYRALENGNLLNAIGTAPILGLGTGQEFEEVFRMPDISFVYDRYRMIPHNLFLASWAYGGLLGILALSLIFSFMVSHTGSLFRYSHQSNLMIFSLCSFFFLIQYIVYTYGDLGLQIPRNQMFAGLLFGGVCRLLAIGRREKWAS